MTSSNSRQDAGRRPIQSPLHSPRVNTYCETYIPEDLADNARSFLAHLSAIIAGHMVTVTGFDPGQAGAHGGLTIGWIHKARGGELSVIVDPTASYYAVQCLTDWRPGSLYGEYDVWDAIWRLGMTSAYRTRPNGRGAQKRIRIEYARRPAGVPIPLSVLVGSDAHNHALSAVPSQDARDQDARYDASADFPAIVLPEGYPAEQDDYATAGEDGDETASAVPANETGAPSLHWGSQGSAPSPTMPDDPDF